MPVITPLPNGHPLMLAWESHKATEEYANTRRWALHDAHVDGSLWAAFVQGWNAREPAPDAERDALKAEVEKAKLEREDALSYAREVATGITHHGSCLGLNDTTDVPCVRCRAEAAEQCADEMREALEKALRAIGYVPHMAISDDASQFVGDTRREIEALLARSGAGK